MFPHNPLLGTSPLDRNKKYSLSIGAPQILPSLDVFNFWGKQPPDVDIGFSYLKLLYENERIAKATQKKLLKERARNAGSAQKPDGLQMLIEKMVLRNPDLSVKDLDTILRSDDYASSYGGIILSINDHVIEFKNGESKKGKTFIKSAKVSGLKDRLSRAKQKIAESQIAR